MVVLEGISGDHQSQFDSMWELGTINVLKMFEVFYWINENFDQSVARDEFKSNQFIVRKIS